MKPFNLEEVRNNQPFEVFFEQLGWIEGKLKHVSKHADDIYEIKVQFNSLDTHDTEWFILPNDRLRMKKCLIKKDSLVKYL